MWSRWNVHRSLFCRLLVVLCGVPLLAQNADSIFEDIGDGNQADQSSLAISDRVAAERSESLANESLVDDAVDPTTDPRLPSSDIPSLVRKVRPSIALILTPTGHGTGVVIYRDEVHEILPSLLRHYVNLE